MSDPPKNPCQHSHSLQSAQIQGPQEQQDPQSQCPQPQCPLSPCTYSPYSPASGGQIPCPPQQCPPQQCPPQQCPPTSHPQNPQQQNSPASNLQSQITSEQYSLHQCPLQPCTLQSPPQPQSQSPQSQCPHSPSSYSPCSPASKVQSPCPHQWPQPQNPPKSPQQQNAPASNSQSQIPPQQYSLHQCPIQPCSHQCPPQPQPQYPQTQCPPSHWSHSQCPPEKSWPPQLCSPLQSPSPQSLAPSPPQNNPPLQSPQQYNPQQQCPQHQWPPIQDPQTQGPPKPCSLHQYTSQPQDPPTLCSHPECPSRQGSQDQWPKQQCPNQQSPALQWPAQQNPMPPSSSPQRSPPSEIPKIPPKPLPPANSSGIDNEELPQHGSQSEMKNPSERIDKPKKTYYCNPVSRGSQKFQTPFKGWGSFDTKMVRDKSDKPVPPLKAPPAQVSLTSLHSFKAEPLLPPEVVSSKKSSTPCPRDRAASKVMTAHQKTRATLRCAMKDLICHAITKTQDAVTAISDESIKQFQKLKKSLSSSNCELDAKGKPKKVSNDHSDTSFRKFSVVNLANAPCKSEKEKSDASKGQSESDPMKFLIEKVDSVVSILSEKLGVEIQNPLKGPWSSYNDQSSKYDVPKPPPPKTKKVENILNPPNNLLSSIKDRIWSMFADDDKPSELSKTSSTTTLSSESDEDRTSE